MSVVLSSLKKVSELGQLSVLAGIIDRLTDIYNEPAVVTHQYFGKF